MPDIIGASRRGLARAVAVWPLPAVAGAARRGLPVPAGSVERDWTQPHVANAQAEAAKVVVHRDPPQHWDLYIEKLTDLEGAFRLWRFRGVTTVEGVLGFKRGTGGTSGVGYLCKLLAAVLFPEIWSRRTAP